MTCRSRSCSPGALVRTPSRGGFALLGLFLVVGAFAYPLAVPIPLWVAGVMWWVDRRDRRRAGERVLGLRDLWRRFRALPRGYRWPAYAVALLLVVPAWGVVQKITGGSQVLMTRATRCSCGAVTSSDYFPERQFFAIDDAGVLWPALALIVGFCLWELRRLPRPSRIGLLVGDARRRRRSPRRCAPRDYGYYFHFKILAFIGAAGGRLAPRRVRAMARWRRWGAVLLASGSAGRRPARATRSPAPSTSCRGRARAARVERAAPRRLLGAAGRPARLAAVGGLHARRPPAVLPAPARRHRATRTSRSRAPPTTCSCACCASPSTPSARRCTPTRSSSSTGSRPACPAATAARSGWSRRCARSRPRGRVKRPLLAIIALGLLIRLAVDASTDGVAFDLQSFHEVDAALRAHGFGLYGAIQPARWPYPPGYFPWVLLAGELPRFEHAIRLAPMAADAGIALVVQDLLGRFGATRPPPPGRRRDRDGGPDLRRRRRLQRPARPGRDPPGARRAWVWTKPGWRAARSGRPADRDRGVVEDGAGAMCWRLRRARAAARGGDAGGDCRRHAGDLRPVRALDAAPRRCACSAITACRASAGSRGSPSRRSRTTLLSGAAADGHRRAAVHARPRPPGDPLAGTRRFAAFAARRAGATAGSAAVADRMVFGVNFFLQYLIWDCRSCCARPPRGRRRDPARAHPGAALGLQRAGRAHRGVARYTIPIVAAWFVALAALATLAWRAPGRG